MCFLMSRKDEPTPCGGSGKRLVKVLSDALVKVRPVLILNFVVIFNHREQVGKMVLALGELFGLGREVAPAAFGNRMPKLARLILTLMKRREVGIVRMAELKHAIEHREGASTQLFALRLANLGLGDMVEKVCQILKIRQLLNGRAGDGQRPGQLTGPVVERLVVATAMA